MVTGKPARGLMTALTLVLATILAACAPSGDITPVDAGAATEDAAATAPVSHAPLPVDERVMGLHDLGEGRTRAVGLLQYRAKDDGIWVLVEGTVGVEPPEGAPVIAVIANMYDLDSACNTSGALAYAEGIIAQGGDTSLPGPALTAEFVARAD